MNALPHPHSERHGRDLTPVDGRGSRAVVDAVSLQGRPLERVLELLDLAELERSLPLRRWGRWRDACDIAALATACDGRRLLWSPEHPDPHPHWQLLRAIGHRQLPVKLVLPYEPGLASWADWASLDGWWVAAPCNARECRALLHRLLDEEWPTVVLLPPEWQEVGGCEHFAWGEGQLCGEGQDCCLISAPDAMPVALEARARLQALGISASLLPCSSINPLPVSLARTREAGLLLVIDQGRSWAGIGGLWQRIRPAIDCSYCGAESHLAAPPLPSDVVAMVRVQLGV